MLQIKKLKYFCFRSRWSWSPLQNVNIKLRSSKSRDNIDQLLDLYDSIREVSSDRLSLLLHSFLLLCSCKGDFYLEKLELIEAILRFL